ncbi:2Fe-2S iron-sulfur cluster binding domain-containing protein [Caproiciproducens galactitolivorans]|uniref:NADP-reducing hydrogenase subunit HndC n=1 Tax=Caproiciproducens galactitolivorans TaxID=642589 RepID=A0A4Z0YDV7_9FIRM|nr:NADH-dependent [FeFe] hydrogenase, group A6 [Caproiciproducens galactitolivorans]QEY35662.1 2Fe-2S iron-sulfur cluster binding domain-containing protein [Caproiciproducens galactitolivorans]TGJ77391.1 NADP-reducing hydrogenase subunit HndC [Caproiciproducens galactitolivorans]
MENMVNIKINGMPLSVPSSYTILEAAREAGIDIPTLCYLKGINEIGACRMCVVEVKGARSFVASCVYPVNEGMEVLTNTPAIQKSRKMTLEMLLSVHNRDCLACKRNGSCELQTLCNELGVEQSDRFDGAKPDVSKDESSLHLIRDNSKCILCRRCVAACSDQHVGVLGPNCRGFDTHIACAFEKPLNEVPCVSCGQCIVSCPTGALTERDQCDEVMAAINDPEKFVVVQTAPAIRATLGECFGLPVGTNVKGKMVAALRRLGFDKVFDTDFGADLTIMEEANELLERVKNGGPLPLITSCSPGWIKFCEYYYPELLQNVSSCKSPQQMTGAIIKTYYAEKNNIDPKKIVVVSVMPCTAKKFEARRDNQDAAGAGIPDTDIAITTRELARLIKMANINFERLPDEEFDPALGITTGAAAIFGATGGVMEAALRTAADTLEGKSLDSIEYKEVRGTEGIKEAVYHIGGMDVKVAAVSGLSNANEILSKVKNGEGGYHFIEIMCCPGGCVNGGGQPLQPAAVRSFTDLKAERAKALYEEDKNLPLRKSHESPIVKTLYEEYLENPGSHKAHKILHTTYVARKKF